MATKRALPLDGVWTDDLDKYVDSLLYFATSSDLFRNLCGGIHILDFLTREPDMYATVIPSEWRDWFEAFDIGDILDLLLREDVTPLSDKESGEILSKLRGGPLPPESLVDFIKTVRVHSLKRQFSPSSSMQNGKTLKIPRQISVGMNPKKIHEVENFARFVDQLSSNLASDGA